jgi:hypothetical protein
LKGLITLTTYLTLVLKILSVKNENHPTKNISFKIPILKDTKTKKSYYIHADPDQPISEKAAFLFNASKRLTIETEDDYPSTSYYFIIEQDYLLVYSYDLFDMTDVPSTEFDPNPIIQIFTFTLSLENGKIIATEKQEDYLYLGF